MTNEEAIEIINRENDPNDKKVWELFPEYREALDMAIKALEQEPCEDAISRQAVEEIINDIRDCISVEGYCAILERLKKLSSVTPQQKIGHWIFVDKAKEHARCSNCGYGDIDLMDGKPHNYCQSCGAKMQERSDKE